MPTKVHGGPSEVEWGSLTQLEVDIQQLYDSVAAKLKAKKEKGSAITDTSAKEKSALAALTVAVGTGDVVKITAAQKEHNDVVTELNAAWTDYNNANAEYNAEYLSYTNIRLQCLKRHTELMAKSVASGSVDTVNTNTNDSVKSIIEKILKDNMQSE
uniref:Uncharacterized protein n=1 Tax=viral metagenome TaxID=1070528 RepID=A0A6C0E3K2_9ZZZZ